MDRRRFFPFTQPGVKHPEWLEALHALKVASVHQKEQSTLHKIRELWKKTNYNKDPQFTTTIAEHQGRNFSLSGGQVQPEIACNFTLTHIQTSIHFPPRSQHKTHFWKLKVLNDIKKEYIHDLTLSLEEGLKRLTKVSRSGRLQTRAVRYTGSYQKSVFIFILIWIFNVLLYRWKAKTTSGTCGTGKCFSGDLIDCRAPTMHCVRRKVLSREWLGSSSPLKGGTWTKQLFFTNAVEQKWCAANASILLCDLT